MSAPWFPARHVPRRPPRSSGRPRASRLAALAVPLLWACDTGTEPILVGTIVLAPAQPSLLVGESLQLAATVLSTTGSALSGQEVTWTSLAPEVASVSEAGLVWGLKAGTAQIRATAGNKTATVSVRVLAGPCLASRTTGSIALGQTISGTISGDDCTMYEVLRGQGWRMELSAPTSVLLAIRGEDFWPDLMLTDLHLQPVLWSSWNPDGVYLVGTLPAGTYIAWAMKYDDHPGGAYTLSAAAIRLCDADAAAAAIGVGGTRTGTLTATDCIFADAGVPARGYRLDLDAPIGLRIDLSGQDLAPLLVVTDRSMAVVAWDFGGAEGGISRIQRRFGRGEYIVWAVGISSNSGSFSLSVEAVEIALCPVVGDLTPGTRVTGSLSSDDCVVEGYWYTDPWGLSVSTRTTIQIDLTSTEFDTLLIVESADGQLIDWDDDGGGNLNSRLVLSLEPGDYRVVATSYSPGATGRYSLVAHTTEGHVFPSRDATRPRAPWLKAMGR